MAQPSYPYGPSSCSTCPQRPNPSLPYQPSYPSSPYPASQPSGCSTCPPRPPYPPIYVATGPTGPAGPIGASISSYYLKGILAAGSILPNESGVILSIPFTVPSGVLWNQLSVNGSFSFSFMNSSFTAGGFYMSIQTVEGNTYNSERLYINSTLNTSTVHLGSGTICDTFETKTLLGGTTYVLRLIYKDLAETGLVISGGTYSFQITPIIPLLTSS